MHIFSKSPNKMSRSATTDSRPPILIMRTEERLPSLAVSRLGKKEASLGHLVFAPVPPIAIFTWPQLGIHGHIHALGISKVALFQANKAVIWLWVRFFYPFLAFTTVCNELTFGSENFQPVHHYHKNELISPPHAGRACR